MNVSGFLSLTRTALIGSHTTVDSAALAAMAGIDIGDTAGDSSEDGMGGFGEFSNQDMLDMLPAGQIEKPSVGDLFEASKAAAASASDMDANHKVAVIDTASGHGGQQIWQHHENRAVSAVFGDDRLRVNDSGHIHHRGSSPSSHRIPTTHVVDGTPAVADVGRIRARRMRRLSGAGGRSDGRGRT
jgi:hypothetical protein